MGLGRVRARLGGGRQEERHDRPGARYVGRRRHGRVRPVAEDVCPGGAGGVHARRGSFLDAKGVTMQVLKSRVLFLFLVPLAVLSAPKPGDSIWSQKPVVRPPVPTGVTQSTNPIDAFIAFDL